MMRTSGVISFLLKSRETLTLQAVIRVMADGVMTSEISYMDHTGNERADADV